MSYGSELRGDARANGDIEIVALLAGPIDYGNDLRTNIHALCGSRPRWLLT